MCIRDRVKRAQHQCHFVQTANDILNRFQEVLSMLFSDQLYQALKQHSVCSRVSWRYLKSHCGFHSFYGSDLPDIFLELNWDPLVSAYYFKSGFIHVNKYSILVDCNSSWREFDKIPVSFFTLKQFSPCLFLRRDISCNRKHEMNSTYS